MRILFDQGTPLPLRAYLKGHIVDTVYERGSSQLINGALLVEATKSFDLFITTDQQLSYQQNLATSKISVLVLMTTSWPRIKEHTAQVVGAIDQILPGEYREIRFPDN